MVTERGAANDYETRRVAFGCLFGSIKTNINPNHHHRRRQCPPPPTVGANNDDSTLGRLGDVDSKRHFVFSKEDKVDKPVVCLQN